MDGLDFCVEAVDSGGWMSIDLVADQNGGIRCGLATRGDRGLAAVHRRAGAVTGFGTTARLLAGVLNLSKGEAKTRADQAELLTPRRSLTGAMLPPALPATAAELAAGAIGPAHLRVITATMRRIPPVTHPGTTAEAEQTLATAARRFDPAALTRIGERLLAHLDPTAAPRPKSPRRCGSCGFAPVPTAP